MMDSILLVISCKSYMRGLSGRCAVGQEAVSGQGPVGSGQWKWREETGANEPCAIHPLRPFLCLYELRLFIFCMLML